jgi:hypothetical protein
LGLTGFPDSCKCGTIFSAGCSWKDNLMELFAAKLSELTAVLKDFSLEA